jgi:hypothetical protein
MKCKDVRRNLIAFLDGELRSPDAEHIQKHLETCEGCQEEAELLRQTLNLACDRILSKPVPTPPENVASLFWQKEREQRAKGHAAPRWRLFDSSRLAFAGKIAAVAVVSAALGVTTLSFLRKDRGSPQHKVDRSETESGPETGVPAPNDRLAQMEKRLEELEESVQRLTVIASAQASFGPSEMREIYAAVGLAAANNYRDVLEMPEEASRRYGKVLALFPETTAGQKPERILSGLN